MSVVGCALLLAAQSACAQSATSQPNEKPAGPGAGAQKIAVPGYFYQPEPGYRQLAENVPAVGLVVANINNGPGADVSREWASAAEATRRAGVTVLGYVDTGYLGIGGHTTRPPSPSVDSRAWKAQIENDVDTWYRFYGPTIGGIFLDQAQKDCGPTTGDHTWVNSYIEIYSYVKRHHPGAMVAQNPGNSPDQCYLRAADIIVTFEGDYSTYVDPVNGYQEPAWERAVSPDRIWHLVYGATQAQMEDAVARARERNAGYVYVTSLPWPNPWHALPSDGYWNRELGRVANSTDTTPPTAPRNLRPAGVYFNKVSLRWESARDDVAVVGYDVYQGASPVTSVHNNSATLAGLATATRYSYTVRARDAAGNVSSTSNAVEVTTPAADDTAPTIPSNVRAVAYSQSVQLTWTASTDPDDSVASYDVYRGGSVAVTVGTGNAGCPTCAIVRGLDPSTRYSFTVKARDEAGNMSPVSKVVTVITLPPASAPIENVSACMDSSTAKLSATYTEAYEYHRVFIDSDNDVSTGYPLALSTPFGADYMVESSLLDTLAYRYDGRQPPRQGAWTWQRDVTVTPAVSAVNGTYTWQIPISALGGSGTKRVIIEGGATDSSTTETYTAPMTVEPHASCP
jgi:chitodextrinase